MKTDPHLLATVITWRIAVAEAEFINNHKPFCEDMKRNTVLDWDMTYLGFNSVSQYELDLVCEHANNWFQALGLPQRVHNSMGEIRPSKARMVEAVDTRDLKSLGHGHEGSRPSLGTKKYCTFPDCRCLNPMKVCMLWPLSYKRDNTHE